MDTIRVSKSDWDRSDRDSFFRGPLSVFVHHMSRICRRSFGTSDQLLDKRYDKFVERLGDQEWGGGGFGPGDVRELYIDDQEYKHFSEDEVVDLSKGDNENGRAGFDGMSVVAYGLKRRLEETVGQHAARLLNNECLMPVLERYKIRFNKSVVDDKGEPSGVKSDVERKKGMSFDVCVHIRYLN
ncbi:hypothetical protein Hanom_Chr13g01198041 [Helianthus anomalus]